MATNFLQFNMGSFLNWSYWGSFSFHIMKSPTLRRGHLSYTHLTYVCTHHQNRHVNVTIYIDPTVKICQEKHKSRFLVVVVCVLLHQQTSLTVSPCTVFVLLQNPQFQIKTHKQPLFCRRFQMSLKQVCCCNNLFKVIHEYLATKSGATFFIITKAPVNIHLWCIAHILMWWACELEFVLRTNISLCVRSDSCMDWNWSWCSSILHYWDCCCCCDHCTMHEKVCWTILKWHTFSSTRNAMSCWTTIPCKMTQGHLTLFAFFVSREVWNAMANVPMQQADGGINGGHTCLEGNP